jgi:hypothetical protein
MMPEPAPVEDFSPPPVQRYAIVVRERPAASSPAQPFFLRRRIGGMVVLVILAVSLGLAIGWRFWSQKAGNQQPAGDWPPLPAEAMPTPPDRVAPPGVPAGRTAGLSPDIIPLNPGESP